MVYRLFDDYLKYITLSVLLLMSVLLSACPPKPDLEITNLSVTPKPITGQVVTLQIVAISQYDEPDATIYVDLPEEVNLVSGNLEWKGSLVANQPQMHELNICVLREGDWQLLIEVEAYESYNETLHLISTARSGEAIPGSRYSSQRPIITPVPVILSPECLGE